MEEANGDEMGSHDRRGVAERGAQRSGDVYGFGPTLGQLSNIEVSLSKNMSFHSSRT